MFCVYLFIKIANQIINETNNPSNLNKKDQFELIEIELKKNTNQILGIKIVGYVYKTPSNNNGIFKKKLNCMFICK